MLIYSFFSRLKRHRFLVKLGDFTKNDKINGKTMKIIQPEND